MLVYRILNYFIYAWLYFNACFKQYYVVIGLSLSWVACGGGLLLLVLDWRDARPLLSYVDYNILVFFPGLFIAVAGILSFFYTQYFGLNFSVPNILKSTYTHMRKSVWPI